MKGNQHYTEKQLERMLSEPAKDDGWGREPVRRPSKLETLKAQLDAETKRAEYYAKRASEIEEAQFRLANEIDDAGTEIDTLRARIAELEAERDRLQGVYELALLRLADVAKATGKDWNDPEGLAGHVGGLVDDRDALRAVVREQAEYAMEWARSTRNARTLGTLSGKSNALSAQRLGAKGE